MSYAGMKLVGAERLARSRLPDSESGGSAVPREPRAEMKTERLVQPRMNSDEHGYGPRVCGSQTRRIFVMRTGIELFASTTSKQYIAAL